MRQGAKEKPYPEFPEQFGDGYAFCLRPSSKRTVQQEGAEKVKKMLFKGFACRLARLSTKQWLPHLLSGLTPRGLGNGKRGNGLRADGRDRVPLR